MPQARLWNARVLPFYFLSHLPARRRRRGRGDPRRWPRCWPATPSGPVRAVGDRRARCSASARPLVFLGVPLGRLPGVEYPRQRRGALARASTAATATTCPSLGRVELRGPRGQGRGRRARAEGARGPGRLARVPAMFATMGGLGQDPDHGCGRAFWEYGDRLETYGTPMAPMMLPYFTDGCIGSMEGLYFESSATTPYHFLMQCELSDAGLVRAARPRRTRASTSTAASGSSSCSASSYYMAYTQWAVGQADAERARSPPVADHRARGTSTRSIAPTSALVTPLAQRAGRDAQRRRHPGPVARPGGRLVPRPEPLGRAARQRRPRRLAAGHDPGRPDRARPTGDSGPIGEPRPARPCRPRRSPRPRSPTSRPATTASRSTSTASGSPVLVKVSYFPNWEASGAEGPYRVTPNLMVVVPTEHARDAALRPHDASTGLAILLTLPRHRRARPPGPRPGHRDARAQAADRRRRPAASAAGPPPEAPPGWGGYVPVPTRPAAPPTTLRSPAGARRRRPRRRAADRRTSLDRRGRRPRPGEHAGRSPVRPERSLRRFAAIGLVATAVDVGLLVAAGPGRRLAGAGRRRGRDRRGGVRLVPRPPGHHLRRRPVGALGPRRR